VKTKKEILEIGLTEEDLRSIWYFITEKGDITRWVGYESKQHLVEKALPEIVATISRIETEESILATLLDELNDVSEGPL
jgi:hypothetical protein